MSYIFLDIIKFFLEVSKTLYIFFFGSINIHQSRLLQAPAVMVVLRAFSARLAVILGGAQCANDTLIEDCFNVGPRSHTLAQY